MTSYRITIKASAARELQAIDSKSDRQRIVQRIESLAQNPRPPGCEKLSGQIDLYRVRSGSWRVVYEIQDDVVLVSVIMIGQRKDIYRKL